MSESSETGGTAPTGPAPRRSRSGWLDARVWLGVAVTLLFLWYALRDVHFVEVGRLIAGADWVLLLGLSIPSYLGVSFLRARRWAHFTAPIQEIATGPLFRAVSVGLTVNNLLPLRAGEVVRPWYLSRETGASGTALLGTVVLERVVDTMTIILLAGVVIALWGASSDGVLARGAILLLPLALLPAGFLVWLRARPEQVIGFAKRLLAFFPSRLTDLVERILWQFHTGLGSLRGGAHLVWIGIDSLLIWFVGSAIPFIAAFWALDIDLGSPLETLVAAWATLVAVAFAVALPAAPGFFGIYHAAAKWALLRFGVSAKTAVACGTLVHAVMWVTITVIGLVVLRSRRTSLRDLGQATRAAGSLPSAAEDPAQRSAGE